MHLEIDFAGERALARDYAEGEQRRTGEGFGSLADKLRAAMRSSKR